MSEPICINVADIVEKNGKTIRQNNFAKPHTIPIGALVEADGSPDEYDWNGIRLFVVAHQRDCDGTPLYGLGKKGESNKYMMIFNGFSDECLRVIVNPDGSLGAGS